MTNKDKDLPDKITDPKLLKSLQELSLTLSALKTLALDLKCKSEVALSVSEQQNADCQTQTPNHSIEAQTTLH